MGYIKHNAIIVTSWERKSARLAREKARELFSPWRIVSSIVTSPVNGYYSFLIAPDGSKEGWSDSDEGEEARREFKRWARVVSGDEGPLSLNVVEVRYGGDDEWARIVLEADDDGDPK